MDIAVVYICFPDKEEAKKMAGLLLDKGLIACANIYGIDSMYKWKGKVMDEQEFVLWAKTRAEKVKEIEDFVGKNHSYQVPCIVHFDIGANESYKRWLIDETKG